jgi:hypothetical protein
MSAGEFSIPTWFFVVAAVPVAMFLVFLVFFVWHTRRNVRAMRSAGVDPYSAGGQIAARLASGTILGNGAGDLETRLRELDDLQARGMISADEHASARARLLGTL